MMKASKKRIHLISIMSDRTKFCKAFLNINGMATGPNFLLIPEACKQRVVIKYKSNTFNNYYEKVFTTEITSTQLKSIILSPLLNTVLFDEQDASIMHLPTQGVKSHDIDGFEFGFNNKLTILSISLNSIFQYIETLKSDYL